MGFESEWSAIGNRLQRRVYKTYEEYIEHQAAKLNSIKDSSFLLNYERDYPAALVSRLREDRVVKRGHNVLCLAARLGGEVRSFIDLGAFAVGLDLNPGPANNFVVHGDFHKLQYANGSVDIVFSNALDHVYNVELVTAEILRVLKPGGYVILEVVRGSEEGKKDVDSYDCFRWETINDILRYFVDAGFEVLRRSSFSFPWLGEHICLQRQDDSI